MSAVSPFSRHAKTGTVLALKSLYKLYKLIYKNIFSIREYILSKCIVYILGQDLEDLLDTEISFSGTSPSEY